MTRFCLMIITPLTSFRFLCITHVFRIVLGDETERFDHYKVLTAHPMSDLDNFQLLSLYHICHEVDLWSVPNRRLTPVLFSVPPWCTVRVEQELDTHNIHYNVTTENLQDWIDSERVQIIQARSFGRSITTGLAFDRFYNYEEIMSYLKNLEHKHPTKVLYQSMGLTYERHEIPALVIANFDQKVGSRPLVFIECGIHAREWISHATCLWIIEKLLQEDGHLLNRYSFHIFPMMNPDGYLYTWNHVRVWRKNRKPLQLLNGTKAFGIDLNRNFDFHFYDKIGKSHDPAEDSFGGFRPFSEEETRALRDYVIKYSHKKIRGYFALHSFGYLWMYPYGRKDIVATNAAELERLGNYAARLIKEHYGSSFEVGTIVEVIYEATGSSLEWIKWNTGARLSFAVEMRGHMEDGIGGFLLPTKEIKDGAGEAWLGIKSILMAA